MWDGKKEVNILIAKDLLKGKIVAAGFTQRDLARRIGMSENTRSNKINGRTKFDTDEILKIDAVLGNMTPLERGQIFFAASVPKQGRN